MIASTLQQREPMQPFCRIRPALITIALPFVLLGCDDTSTDAPEGCRTYSVTWLSDGPGLTEGLPGEIRTPIPVNCRFDAETREYRCRAEFIGPYGSPRIHEKVWQYPDITSFISEARAVGRRRYETLTVTAPGPAVGVIPGPRRDEDHGYDDAGRLVTTNGVAYTAWDALGRPLAAAPTGIRTDDPGDRYDYNDSARTVTRYYSSRTLTPHPDGTVPCIPRFTETEYDADGNVIRIDETGVETRYSVVETETVSGPQP